MEREPLGLTTCASYPAVTSDARQAEDRTTDTALGTEREPLSFSLSFTPD